MKIKILIAFSILSLLILISCDNTISSETNTVVGSAPIISLTGGTDTISVGGTYSESGFAAFDVEDYDITSSVDVSYYQSDKSTSIALSELNDEAGIFYLKYCVSDSDDNNVVQWRKVVVTSSDTDENIIGLWRLKKSDILDAYSAGEDSRIRRDIEEYDFDNKQCNDLTLDDYDSLTETSIDTFETTYKYPEGENNFSFFWLWLTEKDKAISLDDESNKSLSIRGSTDIIATTDSTLRLLEEIGSSSFDLSNCNPMIYIISGNELILNCSYYSIIKNEYHQSGNESYQSTSAPSEGQTHWYFKMELVFVRDNIDDYNI